MTEIIGQVTWSVRDLEAACEKHNIQLGEEQKQQLIREAEFIAQNFLRHTFLEDALKNIEL